MEGGGEAQIEAVRGGPRARMGGARSRGYLCALLWFDLAEGWMKERRVERGGCGVERTSSAETRRGEVVSLLEILCEGRGLRC